jgi:pantoate--beta-alanine ligase
MNVFHTIAELREWRRSLTGTVGFAPTMGNLHRGHIACLKTAQRSANHSVVSIFVNPTQFAPTDDFAKYPRTLDHDLNILKANGCNAVFVPSVDEMYPSGASTKVIAGSMANGLEGDFRPGHFDGVATVCLKLFQIVEPAVVAFGCKDLQQMRVIQQLINDFNMPIYLEEVPTTREKSGLALSSRNRYLTPDGKFQASQLYRALDVAHILLSAGDSANEIETLTKGFLEADGWEVDYLAIRDGATLGQLTPDTVCIASLGAAKLHGVRLIDNITRMRS